MRLRSVLCAIALLVLFLPTSSAAQGTGSISGRISAAEGGDPLQDVIVDVYRQTSGSWQSIPNSDVTNLSGDYTVTGLPAGIYRLGFRGPTRQYSPEYYSNSLSLDWGQSVALGNGQHLMGIDVALAGATISGKVTSEVTGAELEGVAVQAYRLSDGSWQKEWWFEPAFTDSSGNYNVVGLPEGIYRLFFRDPSGVYAEESYDDALTVGGGKSVTLTEGEDVTGVDATLADAATISGRVISANTGSVLEGVIIQLFRFANGSFESWGGPVVTDLLGQYMVRGLPAGAYYLSFVDPSGDYVREFYSDALTINSATAVTVTKGEGLTGVDVALSYGATISGSVTAADGSTPLQGITAQAFRFADGDWQGLGISTTTDSSGNYTLKGLPEGTYRVGFIDLSGGYAPEFHDNAPTMEAAKSLTVLENLPLTGVNAALAEAASISGEVTAANDGVELKGAIVKVYHLEKGSWRQWGSFTTTDSSGKFMVRGLPPGTYRVGFEELSGEYAPEFYPDATTVESAQSVIVLEGQASMGIDAALEGAAMISGRVTAVSSGAGLAGVSVTFYSLVDGQWQPSATSVSTDSSGSYTLKGLPEGTYRVGFMDLSGDYAPEFYNDALTVEAAQSLIVPGGIAITGVDVALSDAATISGKVTAASNAEDLEGVIVAAYHFVEGSWRPRNLSTTTDSSGNYILKGLPAGNYRLGFFDLTDQYASEFHNDVPSVESAQSLTLLEGSGLTGIDAALADAATISGKVTAAKNGAALEGVYVAVHHFIEGAWREFRRPYGFVALSNSSGYYAIKGLPSGTYRLFFRHLSGNYISEYFENASSLDSAQDIDLSEGVEVTGIDAALTGAGRISGKVTSQSDGVSLENVNVAVYRFTDGSWQLNFENPTATDSSGKYSVSGLAPGTYRLGFSDVSGEYLAHFYNDSLTLNDASDVTVTEGEDTPNIDAELSRAATLGGRVTAANGGTGIPGVVVSIYRFNVSWWENLWAISAVTDQSGNYTLRGLPSGIYRVGFSDPSGEYAVDFYNNALTVETGQSVTVAEGADVTGIDAALADGATISGRVTAQTGGAGLGGVNVEVYRYDVRGFWNTVWTGSMVTTDASGNYTVRGLQAGTYRIGFSDPSSNYAKEFYSNAMTVETGQSVTVAEGADVTGIDVALADGATISGRVTAQSGSGSLHGIQPQVYRFIGGYWQQFWLVAPVATDQSGNYTVRGLPSGIYRIGFSDPSGNYAPEFYNNALALETGQSVSVTAGQIANGIDVALDDGATISGRVTARTGGTALQGIRPELYRYDEAFRSWFRYWPAFNSPTDENGDYVVGGLQAGNYRIGFRDPSGAYGEIFYGDAVAVNVAQDVAVSVGQNIPQINVAMSAAAAISGTVVSKPGGTPLEGIQVDVYRYDATSGAWNTMWVDTPVLTDNLGRYSVGGLAAGSYRVGFRDPAGNYAEEYHSDAAFPETGSSVSLVAGQTITDLNAELADAATISGVVTSETGVGLEGISVEIYRYDFQQDYWHSLWTVQAKTDPSGNYLVKGLPAGSYRVGFSDPGAEYAQEFFSNAMNVETSQPITLAEGEDVVDVDASLIRGGSISGTVLSGASNLPLRGVRIGLFSYDPVRANWNYHWTYNIPRTDELGRYTIDGLGPGTYRVGFQHPNEEYAMEFYSNAASVETATNVTLGVGAQVSDVDAVLESGAKISGTVKSLASGEPVSDIVITIWRYEPTLGEWRFFETFSYFVTDAQGNYSVFGLPAGTYSLEFRDTKDVYATQFYSSSPSTLAATSIILAPGQELADLDVALADGGSISGLIAKEDGTSPLKGALVKAHLLVNELWHELWQQRKLSDESGAFSIVGLAPGTYRLEVTDLSGQYATEFYLNANSFASATSIQLNTRENSSVGTVVMGTAASFSGAVTSPDGATPLQGVSVVPRRWNESTQVWELLTSTRTQTNGSFKLEGLPPGTYTFEFVDQSGVYLAEFFSNSPNLTAATRIELQPGQNSQGAQIALALAGYDAWKSNYGVTGSQTSDDDNDGLLNAAEYALGTHPRQADTHKALTIRTSGSDLVLEFLRRNHGATSVLQEINDLRNGSWNTSQANLSESPDQTGVAVGYTRMRCVVPATGRKFFRVLATY